MQYGGSEAHSTFFQRQRGDWEAATQSRDLMTSIRRFYSNAYTVQCVCVSAHSLQPATLCHAAARAVLHYVSSHPAAVSTCHVVAQDSDKQAAINLFLGELLAPG